MALALHTDYDAARLRAAACESEDAGQPRRLLALAAIYNGADRTQAAAMGGVTLQIIRDRVLKLDVWPRGAGRLQRPRPVADPDRRAPRRSGSSCQATG